MKKKFMNRLIINGNKVRTEVSPSQWNDLVYIMKNLI